MIVESHPRQVRVDMSAFKPPSQKVFILDIFRPSGQVPCKLVDSGFMSCMEHGEAVENIIRQAMLTLAHACRRRRKGYLISKPVRAVKLIADDVFGCRNPHRSPTSALEVRKLVAGV